MNSTPGRQALYHFLAAAFVGLALTALSALLPDLMARQQTLAPQTTAYALLSLFISGGMAAYGYVTAHQAQLVDKVSGLLDKLSADEPAVTARPHASSLPDGEGKDGASLPESTVTRGEAQA